ncbi:MAG: alpha/beta hydrolase [Lachnospiraceae bacterium]
MSKLAIYFPGIGYHCDKPPSHYMPKLCPGTGLSGMAETSSYTYEGKNIRGDQAKMREAYETLFQQAEKELEEIDWSVYDDILFVSKSIGTIIARFLCEETRAGCVRQVLHTPLAETFSFTPEKGACLYRNSGIPWSTTERSFSWPG